MPPKNNRHQCTFMFHQVAPSMASIPYSQRQRIIRVQWIEGNGGASFSLDEPNKACIVIYSQKMKWNFNGLHQLLWASYEPCLVG
jgi:hypothetical protein